MPKIHVLTTKEELDHERLADKVVIVLDILFATTTAVAALAHGALEVRPALDHASCLADAAARAPGSWVLAGELDGQPLDGFAQATPLALLREAVAGRSLLYSTTNGTVALRKAHGAAHIYAAALLNARAVASHVFSAHADSTILIVCAGSAGRFNLEDFYGAGVLAAHLRTLAGSRCTFSDAAMAAERVQAGAAAFEVLAQARVGRGAVERGFGDEVHYAAQQDCVALVPKLMDGALRPI